MIKSCWLAALPLLGGCGSANRAVDHPQAAALTMSQWVTGVDKDGSIGDLDLGKYTSGSEMYAAAGLLKDLEPVIMLGVKQGKLCFDKVEDGDPDELRDSAEQLYASSRYAVLVLDKLDEVTAATPWPDPPADKTVEATVEVHRKAAACAGNPAPDLGGRTCDPNKKEMRVRLCIPAPTIPPATHFLAIAIVFPGAGNRNMLPVWRIVGTEDVAPPATPAP